MKNKIKFYLALIICLSSSFLIIKNQSISIADIMSALKISGVSFSEEKTKTMVSYVERNQNAYQEMRSFSLDRNIIMSILLLDIIDTIPQIHLVFGNNLYEKISRGQF